MTITDKNRADLNTELDAITHEIKGLLGQTNVANDVDAVFSWALQGAEELDPLIWNWGSADGRDRIRELFYRLDEIDDTVV